MDNESQNPRLEAALNYVAKGLSVYPTAPNSKVPMRGSRGYLDATTSSAVIEEIWAETPEANLAIATGDLSGVVLVDLDIKGGVDGVGSFRQFCLPHEVPPTLTVVTPSGGEHLYFRLKEGQQIRRMLGIAGGVDVLGDGGGALAPPSRINGVAYVFKNPDAETAELPDWLYEKLIGARAISTCTRQPEPGGGHVIPRGSRNDQVFRRACGWRGQGIPLAQAQAEAVEIRSHCDDPASFSESEALRCVESAYGYPAGFDCTEQGLAEHFASQYAERATYIEGKDWIIWNEAASRHLVGRAHARGLLMDCLSDIRLMADTANSSEQRKEILRFHKSARSLRTQDNALALAKDLPSMRGRVEELDAEPYLFGLGNGILDLSTGEFLESAPAYLILTRSPVEYDQDATCPLFLAFLEQITQRDEQLQRYIQKAVGYSLLGHNEDQVLLLVCGPGKNGKSILLRVLSYLFGGYWVSGPRNMLAQKQRSQTDDLARLEGSRLLTLVEEDDGCVWDETLIKQLVGGDAVTARPLYGKFSDFRNDATPWIATNHLPRIRGRDDAIWRRLRVIPLTYRVPEDRRDRKLMDKLTAESSGILNWAIEGCLLWQQEGLEECRAVEEATHGFRSECDPVGVWLRNHTRPGSGKYTSLRKLYQRFCSSFEGESPISETAFANDFKRRRIASRRTSKSSEYELVLVRYRRVRRVRRVPRVNR